MHSGCSEDNKNYMNTYICNSVYTHIYATTYIYTQTHTSLLNNTLKESSVAIELLNAATLIVQLLQWCSDDVDYMYMCIYICCCRTPKWPLFVCVCVRVRWGLRVRLCFYWEICQSLELLLIEMLNGTVKQINMY